MSLRLRLILSYVGVAALVLVVGLVGIVTSRQIIHANDNILKTTSPSLNALSQIEAAASVMRETAVHHALFKNIGADSIEVGEFNDAVVELNYWLAELKPITNEVDLLAAIEVAAPSYIDATQNLINVAEVNANDNTALYTAVEAIEEPESRFSTALEAAIEEETEEFKREFQTSQSTANTATVIDIAAMIAVVSAALVLGVFISGRIVKPINHLQQVSSRMTQGDYSQRSDVQRGDEIGQLSTAFNTMASAIQERNLALSASNVILEQRIDERTKELRIATREAQEASRLKDEFLAIMSHELRTPLNAMIGFQGILLMTGKLDEKAQHMIRRAQANAHRLLTLINDILDVSRIESGRMQFVKSEVSLHDLVDRLQSQMSVLADEKKLQFTVDIDTQLPPAILIDEDAITKIITNLLGNAFKFTEKGSVNLKLAQRESNIVITVQDTGIGIPTHMHNAIFERFRQVDGSSNRTHGGSGLGLAIVQKLVLALNGTINVQSTVGEGSTFTVVLPLEAVNEKVAV